MMLLISSKYGTSPEIPALIEAAKAHGMKAEVLLNSYREIPSDEILAFYGEHAFCEFMAQEFRYNLYSNSIDWVARLVHSFVKRSVKCITMEEVIDIENDNQSILGQKILEPADDPCFKPGIHSMRFPRVPNKTPVLVSTDHTWLCKYRYIIMNGRALSRCCYQLAETFNTPAIWGADCYQDGINAEGFIKALLEHNNTAPACVIDVGYIKDHGWSVCGTYPIWTSAIYGCNPHHFLNALFTGCQKIRSSS